MLCADVWDCLGEYTVGVLKQAVMAERAAKRLDYLPLEPLVVYVPQGRPEADYFLSICNHRTNIVFSLSNYCRPNARMLAPYRPRLISDGSNLFHMNIMCVHVILDTRRICGIRLRTPYLRSGTLKSECTIS